MVTLTLNKVYGFIVHFLHFSATKKHIENERPFTELSLLPLKKLILGNKKRNESNLHKQTKRNEIELRNANLEELSGLSFFVCVSESCN